VAHILNASIRTGMFSFKLLEGYVDFFVSEKIASVADHFVDSSRASPKSGGLAIDSILRLGSHIIVGHFCDFADAEFGERVGYRRRNTI
jgi:hypothetical protein